MRAVSTLLQFALAIVSWILFGWLWWIALLLGPTDTQLHSTLIVVVVNLAIALITMLWVRWNIAIFKRKGARTAVPAVEYTYDYDCAGTPVVIPAAVRRGARSILIDMEGEGDVTTKVYYAASGLSLANA
ncbi:MAG: hypothetical protein RBS17_10225 [Coriobacteriia bacterium]|nr:hypothetical protein [Coriobacteriia bacterium]